MKKLVTNIITFGLAAAILLAVPSQAFANTARSSASLAKKPMAVAIQKKKDNRAEILELYLKRYNSPLVPHAKTFVEEADKQHISWKWVVSIAGVESYFGQQIPPYSYNGWGYGVYGNNVRNFASWDDGITTVSKALRDDYLNKWGATNIYEVGHIYAADPAWANKVTHFITELDAFEKDFETRDSNTSLSISL